MSRLAWCLALLLLSSCRDEAAEAFARADMKYRDLVTQAVRPEDPRFDEVLRELEKVPQGSRHYANAQKLVNGIKAVRASRVRTPLALAPNGRRAPELEAHLAACARLATMAGADGGVDLKILKALDECRLQAEKLELRFSHPEEFADGGDPHGHEGEGVPR